MNMKLLYMALTPALLSASGLVLLKKAATAWEAEGNKLWLTGLAGFTLYAASFALWLLVIAKFDLSKSFPLVTGFTLIFTVTASVLFLGETVTPKVLFGVLLIVTASFFIH